jgi:thiol-disulfide isomerase/thioredoxin
MLILPKLKAQDNASRIIKWGELEKILSDSADSTTIMIFWASWCKPCLREIPVFEKIRKEKNVQAIRFIYVSLDFAKEKAEKLDPFVKNNLLGAKVLLLDEPNYNNWLKKVEPDWNGSIPMTLVLNNSTKKRLFAESEITEQKLRSMIDSISFHTNTH